MNNFFAIPDKERNHQSYMVYMLAVMWSIVIIATVSFGFYLLPHLWLRWTTYIALALMLCFATLTLNHLGYSRGASWAFCVMLWLCITVPCYSTGGITAPGILEQTSVILTAGFLLGWRGGLAIGLLTIGANFWFVYLELIGELPTSVETHSPLTRWIASFIPFGTILALQYYATDHLRTSLNAMKREIAKRESAEKTMNQTVNNLKTLYAVSYILQDDDVPFKIQLQKIVELLPEGWQYPEIAAASICFAGIKYTTKNYKEGENRQLSEIKTATGELLTIEIVYLAQKPQLDEGPFLKEERNLLNVLAETIKKNLERRVQRNELKDYKYALDVGFMTCISGVDSVFTSVNDNFCKRTRYSPSELLGQKFDMVMSDLHQSNYFKELSVAMQEGKPHRGEFCNKTKDGNLGWVNATVIPFLNDNGEIYQYLSILYDITERKDAEEAKMRSDEKYRSLIEHAGDAIFQVDKDNFIIEVNQSACELLGYSREELQSMKASDIYPGSNAASYTLPDWIELNKNKTLIDERTLQRKDGTLITVEVSKKSLADKEGYLGIVRDITKRKESEEKLRQTEQLLKKITSQVPANTYMFEIDEEGNQKILFTSRGNDMFNHHYAPVELTELPQELLKMVHPDDRVRFKQTMKNAAETGKPLSMQYRMGEHNMVRWRWLQAVPEKEANGKVLWYGASNDITTLVEYIASTEQIIFDISHIIRRPVSSLLGLSKLILDADLTMDDVRDISEKLYQTAEEMDKVIHDLNAVYIERRKNTALNIDISTLIDKRSFLFR